jgi:hypothetical protein
VNTIAHMPRSDNRTAVYNKLVILAISATHNCSRLNIITAHSSVNPGAPYVQLFAFQGGVAAPGGWNQRKCHAAHDCFVVKCFYDEPVVYKMLQIIGLK